MNNKNNTTKVICQNCGAEIVIPNNEHKVSGVAIGKDSGLGTVVLPTVDTNGKRDDASLHGAIGAIASSIGGCSKAGHGDPIAMIADLIAKIEDNGYIDVSGIVRRWIPSQCVRLLSSPDGFHSQLKGFGIDYSWSVLIADLKRQKELFANKDIDGFWDRNRWYNSTVAADMAEDFLSNLKRKVMEMPTHFHKKREYVKLTCSLNYGRGVHLDELNKYFKRFESLINKIRKATSPEAVYEAAVAFDNERKQVRRLFIDMAPSFMNAYKAAGAYYTMKDFIMFEGFSMKVNKTGSTEPCGWKGERKFVKQEESLAALERKAADVVLKGVSESGFELLGLLKDFLEYNNFNYKETTEKWAMQSKARRLMRAVNKVRRPR